jgi:hypothetical protein
MRRFLIAVFCLGMTACHPPANVVGVPECQVGEYVCDGRTFYACDYDTGKMQWAVKIQTCGPAGATRWRYQPDGIWHTCRFEARACGPGETDQVVTYVLDAGPAY